MENTIYKDELTKSMNYLALQDNTIFVGQQIVYKGNPMSTTLEEVPKEKMIETYTMPNTIFYLPKRITERYTKVHRIEKITEQEDFVEERRKHKNKLIEKYLKYE